MRLETINDKLTFFCGALAAWTILFLFVNFNLDLPSKLGKKKNDDVKNRVVSIVHGLFALLVSGYHLYRDEPQYSDPASNIQQIIILTSIAYFTYDFVACAYYGLCDTGLILHHGMCMIGFGSCVVFNNATCALCALFLAEVSNFPMHFRCILRTFQMRYTKLYELSEMLYLITYMIARGVGITMVTINAVPVAEVPIMIRLTCIGMWLQSLYFVYEMFGIMQRKVKNYKERCKKNISYDWFGDNQRINELSYYRKEGVDKIF